jgi:transcription initiation factor IIE alpha subunit
VFCPNCKSRIQLVDPDASFERARGEIDGAMDDLARTINRMNRRLGR